MGLKENGNVEMGMSDFPLGSKNKYKRMDAEVIDYDDDDPSHHHHQLEKRRKSTRNYVLACAVFASLNNVLLGYGNGFFIFPHSSYFDFVDCFAGF